MNQHGEVTSPKRATSNGIQKLNQTNSKYGMPQTSGWGGGHECTKPINENRVYWQAELCGRKYYMCSKHCIGSRALKTHLNFLQEVRKGKIVHKYV